MVKKKKQTEEIKPMKFAKEVDSDVFDNGDYVSRVSAEKLSEKNFGVRVRTGKRFPYFRQHRPGIWLPENLDVAKWFNWLLTFVKKISPKVWKKEIDLLQEKVSFFEKRVINLTEDLSKTTSLLDEARSALETEERQRKLAEKLVDHIDKYALELKKLKDLIEKSIEENTGLESEIKKEIKKNRWMLGLDCEIGASEKPIDTETSLDLHVVTDINQDKIFEFKSPNIKPFYKDSPTSRLKINNELGQGINQLIQYLRKTDIYSNIQETGSYKIQQPLGVIAIGYNLDADEQRLLKNWNFNLKPHIQIVTFDELLKNAERQIENIRKVRSQY